MVFRQLIHDDLGCASYLVGDEEFGVAAVVDPKLDIDEYLRLADYLGLRIVAIFETHNHADHVSGHGRLAAATGAPIYINRIANPEYEHVALEDGDEVAVGALKIRALHTPGHRPEHTCFLLIDDSRSGDPWAVLTGDTLFVGDVARADLAVDAEEGARGMFRSLHSKLLTLPDNVEIWPAHLGGSLCGGPGMDMKVSSTIGFEKANQSLLAIEDEDEFVEVSTRNLPDQPPNFASIVEVNRGPLVESVSEAPRLSPGQLEELMAAGTMVVDVRAPADFDRSHIPGAVAITITGAGFGTRLAWLAGTDSPVAFVGDTTEDGERAALLAAAINTAPAVGVLEGGFDAWVAEGRPVDSIEPVTVHELYERWQPDGGRLQVLDVREPSAWREGHIPGSVNMPYRLIDSIPEGIDPDRPVAAICGLGQRSAVAASLLKRYGASEVLHVVDGGVGTWRRAGWPVES